MSQSLYVPPHKRTADSGMFDALKPQLHKTKMDDAPKLKKSGKRRWHLPSPSEHSKNWRSHPSSSAPLAREPVDSPTSPITN